MQTSVADSTPKVYFLDLEVHNVPVDKGEPRRCIKQICLYDPSREEGKRVFEAHVKPPKELRHQEDEVSFTSAKTIQPKYEFSVVWPHLKEWVNEGLDGNRFAVIIGHNIYKHDWKILEEECARIQEAIPKYWKPFCTMYLAGALGIPKGEQSLSSLCKRYDIKHLPQHNARNDVEMLVNLFGRMADGADLKKLANAMVLPPREHPVREVANVIRAVQDAVLVFFDFESTGLFPKEGEEGDNPRATELGAYIPSKNATFSSFIDPGLDEGIVLSKEVVEKTHITEAMIREAGIIYKQKTGKAMNFEAVWMDFEAWMAHEIGPTVKKVVVLAGHNIWGYDLKLYKAECERFGMKHQFWKSMDTCVLSRHVYKGLSPQPKGFHSLEQLGKRFGIKNENAHRALADVIANARIWEFFVQGVNEDKLNSALLSKHPILSTGQLIREEGGTFKPQEFMVDRNVQPLISDAMPVPAMSAVQSLPAVPSHASGGQKNPDAAAFFGFANDERAAVPENVPQAGPSPLKRQREVASDKSEFSTPGKIKRVRKDSFAAEAKKIATIYGPGEIKFTVMVSFPSKGLKRTRDFEEDVYSIEAGPTEESAPKAKKSKLTDIDLSVVHPEEDSFEVPQEPEEEGMLPVDDLSETSKNPGNRRFTLQFTE